jgi:hypothetical protein
LRTRTTYQTDPVFLDELLPKIILSIHGENIRAGELTIKVSPTALFKISVIIDPLVNGREKLSHSFRMWWNGPSFAIMANSWKKKMREL